MIFETYLGRTKIDKCDEDYFRKFLKRDMCFRLNKKLKEKYSKKITTLDNS